MSLTVPTPANTTQTGQPLNPDRDLMVLYFVWGTAGGVSENTLRMWRTVLSRVSAEVGPLLTVTGEQLSAWLARPDWGQWTRCSYFTALASFYGWAELTDRITVSPLRKVRRPRSPKCVPQPAPIDAYRRIVEADTDPWTVAVMLAALAGLRAADIAHLERERVTQQTITIVGGKGGKDAVLPTHADIWRRVQHMPAGLVVRTGKGEPFQPNYLSWAFGNYVETLGLPRVTLHKFRHLYGTMVYRQTRDLLVTQRLMRHSSVATTQGYALVEDEAAFAAIGGLSL